MSSWNHRLCSAQDAQQTVNLPLATQQTGAYTCRRAGDRARMFDSAALPLPPLTESRGGLGILYLDALIQVYGST